VTPRPCIAVLGERIIDLVPGAHAGEFVALPGGSPANVALALARLGVDPMLLGRRAADGFAEVLDANLGDSGLSVADLIDAGGLSMLAVCTPDATGSMSYSFYTADSPDLCWSATELDRARESMSHREAVAWHTGSLVTYRGPGAQPLLQAWRQARREDRLTLSYDPNARPQACEASAMREYVEAYAMVAHVVKASEEDLAYCYPEVAPESVCGRWVESGPVIVVLTRGAAGATVWQRGHGPVDVAVPAVTVADTVGAGDTVMAGLLAGLAEWFGPDSEGRLAQLPPSDLFEVVSRAVTAAALTCTRPGAQPPTLAELNAFLETTGSSG
jgi:fructokinase